MYFDGMFELFVSLEDLFFIEEIFLLKGEGIVFEMGEGLAEAALIQDDGAVLYWVIFLEIFGPLGVGGCEFLLIGFAADLI